MERCEDCKASKTILIERTHFGIPEYLCHYCFNIRFGHNYFLKKEQPKAEVINIPSFLKH